MSRIACWIEYRDHPEGRLIRRYGMIDDLDERSLRRRIELYLNLWLGDPRAFEGEDPFGVWCDAMRAAHDHVQSVLGRVPAHSGLRQAPVSEVLGNDEDEPPALEADTRELDAGPRTPEPTLFG